jgi:hypothetical protein
MEVEAGACKKSALSRRSFAAASQIALAFAPYHLPHDDQSFQRWMNIGAPVLLSPASLSAKSA